MNLCLWCALFLPIYGILKSCSYSNHSCAALSRWGERGVRSPSWHCKSPLCRRRAPHKRRFAFLIACSPKPRQKVICASFLMRESRCTPPSRHGSRHHRIRFRLSLLPTPIPCSPPLHTSIARSFNRRPSSLFPKPCHPLYPLPLKLHHRSLSRLPHASWRPCTGFPKGLPTRRSPKRCWFHSPLSRNM